MIGSWPRGPLSLQKRTGLMEVLLRAGAVWYGRAMTAALESSLTPSHACWRCVLPQSRAWFPLFSFRLFRPQSHVCAYVHMSLGTTVALTLPPYELLAYLG